MGSGRGRKNSNNNSNSNNNGALNQIPGSSKKVIQSIKEIFNFPEDEIYLMLKDCNMDPSETVNRLLSQDTFHEVKSKREKKKETKDVTESRSRGNSCASTRGSRGTVDRYATRNSTTQLVSSDSAAQRGKPVYKKEIGPPAYQNFTMGISGNNINSWQTADSDAPSDKKFSVNSAASIIPTSQPSGFPSAWSRTPGQVSMADIVKMGRPHGKPSSNLNVSQQLMDSQHAMPSLPAYDPRISQNHASKASEVNSESEFAGHENVPPNDDWPRDEEPPLDSEENSGPYDRTKQQFRSQVDDVRFEEDDAVDEHVESVPGSNHNFQENKYNSAAASGFDNDTYQSIGSYQAHHQDGEDPNVAVSSMTNNFENLSLPKDEEDAQYEDEDAQSEDDGPAVKIPEHLQVKTADLSHLSFGSFGSLQSNEEKAAVTTDAPSVGYSEARNSEYYDNEHLRTAPDGNNAHRMGTRSSVFDTPSVPQSDILQHDGPEVAQPNQYSFPTSTSNYTFENSQQLDSSFAHSAASSQTMQGLPSLTGDMYSSSLPNALLASNIQEAELAYSQFPISQSMAGKYNSFSSSLNDPTASMAELLKATNLTAQQTQSVPQHMAMHPYSQHSLPLGPLNMMGYPFLHQTYAYMPPAFQQAFATGNSAYPQSLASGFSPSKNNVSANSSQQSGAVLSGHGGFGNSNNAPSNYSLNPPPSAPSGTPLSYEDLLASQYKDASHLLSLHQGGGPRTMSGFPGNTYYSFPGQNQLQAGFRTSQQPSQQHYGPPSGYPNYYHSQAGLSLDQQQQQQQQQQQLSRDGSLGGTQGQQQKPTQQHLWQNNY